MVAKIQKYLLDIANTIEKIKMIFEWTDFQKTMVFLVATFVIYALLIDLPLKFLIIISLWINLNKNKNYYKNLHEYNNKFSQIVLRYVIKKKKLCNYTNNF